MIHTCEGCGLVHDTMAAPQESAEVAIARIQADSAYKIAQIAARQDRDWNETRVEVAELETEAEVDAAVAEAEIVGAALEAGIIQPEPVAPAPVIIDSDISADSEADPEELPPVEGSPAPEAAPSKRAGLGMW